MNKYDEQNHSQNDMLFQSSHLFLVRVWLGKNANGTRDASVCGKVQDVSTGQAHYFRGCAELTKVLRRMMPASQVEKSSRVARTAGHKDKV